MSDTFSWIIRKLDSKVPEGHVFRIHYNYVGKRVDEDFEDIVYTANIRDSIFVEADPTSDDYVLYDDLTEGICIQWLQDITDEIKLQEYQTHLTGKLDEQQNPTRMSELPWQIPFEGEQLSEELISVEQEELSEELE